MLVSLGKLASVSASAPGIQQLVAAIQTQEGPVQNNNPGNLLYAGQPGATGKDYRGFAIFSSLDAGTQAEASQISLDINRGTCATGAPVNTLRDLFNCLTPPSANDTAGYTSRVSSATGIDPDASLASVFSSGGDITSAGADWSSVIDAGLLPADLTVDSLDPITAVAIGAAALLAAFLLFR